MRRTYDDDDDNVYAVIMIKLSCFILITVIEKLVKKKPLITTPAAVAFTGTIEVIHSSLKDGRRKLDP